MDFLVGQKRLQITYLLKKQKKEYVYLKHVCGTLIVLSLTHFIESSGTVLSEEGTENFTN